MKKAVLSSKGQFVIPKNIRQKMGLHCGSELILEVNDKNVLEISPVKNNISLFFGMGKHKKQDVKLMSVKDIDNAISAAVIKNDRN